MDTSSIVTQLMSIERAPVTRMTNDMAVENSRKAALQDISTKLLSLRTAADSLRSIPFWAGTPHGASGDDSSYSLSVTSGAPKANYQIQVKRLATGEVWGHTATSGVRDFGAAMAGLNTFAAKTTTLTTLTDASGASLGVQVGQQISMSGIQGGAAYASATPFTVTATSTLDDLRTWIQGQVPGSSVSIETGGRIRIKSPVGSDQEMTSLALSTGGAAAAFDTAFGSSTQVGPAATGDGKIDADDTLHITAGGVTANVVLTAGMSMAQVAAAVNATNGGVIATVVDGKLRVSAKDTGATAGTVSITSDGATAGIARLHEARLRPERDRRHRRRRPGERDQLADDADRRRHAGAEADLGARHHGRHRSDVGRPGRRREARLRLRRRLQLRDGRHQRAACPSRRSATRPRSAT